MSRSDWRKSHARRELAEAVRQACLEELIEGYDHARASGLGHQGAFNMALYRVRRLSVEALVQSLEADQNSMRRFSGSNT